MMLEDKIRQMLAKSLSLKPEEITPNAHLINDLGADSLDLVELVMSFEEEFGVDVPDEDVQKITTFSGILSYIERRLSQT
ncbi:MAG: acyl carrier protein [Candidatus Lindowbacteria bacterium]|nr:acyl carrier protein [Candidatus Lindowbacteria bacterium]